MFVACQCFLRKQGIFPGLVQPVDYNYGRGGVVTQCHNYSGCHTYLFSPDRLNFSDVRRIIVVVTVSLLRGKSCSCSLVLIQSK